MGPIMPNEVVSAGSRLPNTDDIKAAMEVAGKSIEGAEYLVDQVTLCAQNAKSLRKTPELRDNIINAVQRFAELIKFKFLTKGQPWAGDRVETSKDKNLQNNIADAALKDLNDAAGNRLPQVVINFAVGKDGHYKRAYTSDKAEINNDKTSALDKIFSAWLASKDLLIKDGFIFNANDQGQKPGTNLAKDEVKTLLADDSLKQFMADKDIKAECKERDYPGEKKEQKISRNASNAIEQLNNKAAPEPNNDEPSGPSSRGM